MKKAILFIPQQNDIAFDGCKLFFLRLFQCSMSWHTRSSNFLFTVVFKRNTCWEKFHQFAWKRKKKLKETKRNVKQNKKIVFVCTKFPQIERVENFPMSENASSIVRTWRDESSAPNQWKMIHKNPKRQGKLWREIVIRLDVVYHVDAIIQSLNYYFRRYIDCPCSFWSIVFRVRADDESRRRWGHEKKKKGWEVRKKFL